MEVVLRCKLLTLLTMLTMLTWLTLLTLLTLFIILSKLLYSAKTLACMPIREPFKNVLADFVR